MPTTAQQLEKELKALDEGFTVIPNPNRPGLSNIFYQGVNYDLPVVSTLEIKDEIDHGHRYEFPNGHSARHHSKPEIMGRIKSFLERFKSGALNEDYGG